ncbi:MAG TPA: sugar-specific transcriptional regulator TrmB [Methanocorpusculum sp.]|nr:sugar-specific transcriptional regulator TrmB [Methanocorpusculum sp.]
MASKEKSGGVLARRDTFLSSMRKLTFEDGFFTAAEIAEECNTPRSTAQDWINRLLAEGCIFQKDEPHGRSPAKYASRSAMPETTCKRIFTTVSGDDVEIFHECLSSGCAGFCEFHHKRAGGAAVFVERDGMIFRIRAKAGRAEPLNLKDAAVGLVSVEKKGEYVYQTIRSIPGGPAYSLSSMMSRAKGVCCVKTALEDGFVNGIVRTKALVPVTVGIDDTDRKGCGGATFALAQALLKYLSNSGGVIGIRHQVAVLSQDIEEKTAGNSCSFIELAVTEEARTALPEKICRFVAGESVSKDWGVAVFSGIYVPDVLKAFAAKARSARVSEDEAKRAADLCGVKVFGGRGIIGALASIGLKDQPQDVLLDPVQKLA